MFINFLFLFLTFSFGATQYQDLNVKGHVTTLNQKELRASELTTNGTNYVSLKAPSTLSSNVGLTLPPNDGSSGQVLTTDGNGVLTFENPSATAPSNDTLENLGLSASVGSSALTIRLKQTDETTDPSVGAGAVKIGMRSSTLTSGAYNQRSVTTATSLVVSSGSTLGTRSGVESNLYLYAIDNAGTIELAISRTLVHDNTLVSTTAEGGAGAADSYNVLYSTTARSNVPCRVIAVLTQTQTTAGTWAAVPTTTHIVSNYAHAFSLGKFSFQALRSGSDQTGINTNNSYVKIQIDTITTDHSGGFDTTNNRFVAGTRSTWIFGGYISPNNTNILASRYSAVLYVNGAFSWQSYNFVFSAGQSNAMIFSSPPVELNAGEYAELYIFGAGNNSASTLTVSTGNAIFYGHRIR